MPRKYLRQYYKSNEEWEAKICGRLQKKYTPARKSGSSLSPALVSTGSASCLCSATVARCWLCFGRGFAHCRCRFDRCAETDSALTFGSRRCRLDPGYFLFPLSCSLDCAHGSCFPRRPSPCLCCCCFSHCGESWWPPRECLRALCPWKLLRVLGRP